MAFVLLDVAPETAAGGMVGTICALILFAVKVGTWWLDRQRKKAMAEADTPVAPLPLPLPAPAPPPSPDAHRVRIAQLEERLDSTEWKLSDFRRHYRQIELDLKQVSEDAARTAMALQATRLQLEKTQADLTLARVDLKAAEERARKAVAELVELKRQIAGGRDPLGLVTPLPPRPVKP